MDGLSRWSTRPWIADAPPPSKLGAWLDRFADDQRTPFGLPVPAYLAFGVAGIAAGAAVLTLVLALDREPLALLGIITVVALTVFVVIGLVRQKLLRTEQHALIEDVVLVLGAVAGTAALLGENVAALLDATVLALGAFLVFGRLGCLAFGCCHGLPSRVGVRYHRGLHEDDPLTGVRLFPLQLIEAAWLALLTGAGLVLVAGGVADGVAVSVWLVGYCAVRFALEFARGDRYARRLGPLTLAQYLCLAVGLTVIGIDEARDGADAQRVAALAAALAVVGVAYAARSRWLTVDRGPADERVAAEWQVMLPQLEAAASDMAGGASVLAPSLRGAVRTSLVIDPLDHGRELHAVALAGLDWELGADDAGVLAGLVLQRLPAHRVVRADGCEHGTFHLWTIVDPQAPAGSTVDDPPALILLRARAAAGEARGVPERLARDTPIDPRLMPPASAV